VGPLPHDVRVVAEDDGLLDRQQRPVAQHRARRRGVLRRREVRWAPDVPVAASGCALGPAEGAPAPAATDVGRPPYLTTPEHTASARAVLGDGPLLAVEQSVVLSDDPDVVRERAHWHLEIYTGLPNYRNSWLREGFVVEDLVRGGSDRSSRALVVGGEQAILDRVREHLDAGADHVCLQVLGADATDVPADDWARLAPVVASLR
jgi:probable F420-dependent oxidoreductase